VGFSGELAQNDLNTKGIESMKVAVVHNGDHEGILHRFGRPCPERYSLRHVRMVADALTESGHMVGVLEADVSLFDELRRFMPPDPLTGAPTGMVFNMAYGIQGDARYTHLPAMLEMAGVPYTGSTPLGHALALDKVITKVLMLDAGVPTPAYRVLGGPEHCGSTRDACGVNAQGLQFPLIVKPRHESTSYGLRLVNDEAQLNEAVAAIVEKYQEAALVEEYIDGREVCIGLLGNEAMEFLPPVELDFGGRGLKLMTWEDKFHKRMDEPQKVCPAPLAPAFVERLNRLALATFRACHLRDYARVDVRIDAAGEPFVLEVNSMASLGDGGSYVCAARAAGYDYTSLVARILEEAQDRYDFSSTMMLRQGESPTFTASCTSSPSM
jgi:D-alanine-D-alanine ligase